MANKIAVYPGSFNPFHLGHMDVLSQALELFDEIYIAVGASSPNKGQHAVNDRIARLAKQLNGETALGRVKLIGYTTLLTTLIRDMQAAVGPTKHIIRGLRSGHDLDYEVTLRKFVHDINPDIEFVYFVPRTHDLYHVSSSMIREIAQYDKKLAKKYIINGERLEDENLIS